MVSVDDAALDPGEIVLGAKVQVRPEAGAQESEICPLKPPTAADPIFTVPLPPAVTVTLWAERLREKSAPVTEVAGTRDANKPLVWFAPPAVKYRVFGSPVPPAPKTMSHKPGFVITWLAESVTCARKWPVVS